jgi:SAM-dependent methyltransferase
MSQDGHPPAGSAHWDAHAARWRLIGAPLRPAPPDIEYLRASVARLGATPLRAPSAGHERTALLLGVTPEIAEIVWEPPHRLVAVDKSEGMVKAVWPGDTATRRGLVGDWLALDLPEAPFDLVIGDGVFSLFDFPHGYARLARSLAELVKPGGLLSLRLFCRPEPSESLEQVLAALSAGAIGNFHVFKWRLAMSLQGDATRGVRLADIWSTFRERAGSVAEVAARAGWPEPVVGTIEGYRDVEERYSFSTEREVVDSLAAGFELADVWRPSYELGDRCPSLSPRARG